MRFQPSLAFVLVLASSGAASAQTQPAPPPPPTSPSPPLATSPWAAGGAVAPAQPAQPAAQQPPQPVTVVAVAPPAEADAAETARRLGNVLRYYDEQQQARRRLVMITGLAATAVSIGAGVGLITRGDDLGVATGVSTLAIGAGVGLGVILGMAIRTPTDEVLQRYEAARAQGRSPAEVIAHTERGWHEIVERNRSMRRIAAVGLIIGGAVMALGGGILVTQYRDFSDGSAISAVLLLPLGALTAVAGAAVYHQPEEVEVGWEVWRRARGSSDAYALRRPPTLLRPQLALAPVRGGAVGGVTLQW